MDTTWTLIKCAPPSIKWPESPRGCVRVQTLFVARLAYDVDERKLKREMERCAFR